MVMCALGRVDKGRRSGQSLVVGLGPRIPECPERENRLQMSVPLVLWTPCLMGRVVARAEFSGACDPGLVLDCPVLRHFLS